MTAPAAQRLNLLRVDVKLGSNWYDLAQYVELGEASLEYRAGFTDRFGDVAPATWSFELINNGPLPAEVGQFTPDNPASPYAGLFVEGALIRIAMAAPLASMAGYDGNRYRQQLGEIVSIEPTFPGDDEAYARVTVTCVDVLARLERRTLRDMLTEQTLLDGAIAFWQLNDAAGATAAAESSTYAQAPLIPGGNVGQLNWGGGRGTAYDGASSLMMNQDPATAPAWLDGRIAWTHTPGVGIAQGFIFECWVTLTRDQAAGLGANTGVLVEFANAGSVLYAAGGGLFIGSSAPLQVMVNSAGVMSLAGSAGGYDIADGALHHIAIVPDNTIGGSTTELMIDGVVRSSVRFTPGFVAGGSFRIGATMSDAYFAAYGGTQPKAGWPGTIGRAAIFNWPPPASPSGAPGRFKLLARYTLATSMTEQPHLRVLRLLSYLGGQTINKLADAGGVLDYITSISGADVGPQNTAGMTLLAAIQEAWRGEGGRMWTHTTEDRYGPWYAPNARVDHSITFAGRKTLRPVEVSLQLHVEADLAEAPILERSTDGQVSVVTSQSPTMSVTYLDPTLSASIGTVGGTVDTALATAAELGYAAEDRAAQTRAIRLRVVGVTVDPFTGSFVAGPGPTPRGLFGPLLGLVPGQRVRVVGLPANILGYSVRDAYVVSWEESHGIEGSPVRLVLVAADDPAEARAGDDTYGRISAGGTLTLAAALAKGATSMQVQFASVGLTLDAADYPLDLDVQGERVTLAAPPAGATSPQTVAIVRGVGGTVDRAHASGEQVEVWLAPTVAW